MNWAASLQKLLKDLCVISHLHWFRPVMMLKTIAQISKRDLVLVDKSSYSIRMTLWGKSAETFEAESAPVIAFRGVKVGDFGGRSLSMVSSSTMMVEPDISSAHELRGWYDSAGHQEGFQTHSSACGGANAGSFKTNEAKTITEVKDEGLGMSDTPQYFDVRATTVFIKQESFSYPACPADRCNKKLVMEGNDEWRCEKCDRTYPAPEYRCVRRYIAPSGADSPVQRTDTCSRFLLEIILVNAGCPVSTTLGNSSSAFLRASSKPCDQKTKLLSAKSSSKLRARRTTLVVVQRATRTMIK